MLNVTMPLIPGYGKIKEWELLMHNDNGQSKKLNTSWNTLSLPLSQLAIFQGFDLLYLSWID